MDRNLIAYPVFALLALGGHYLSNTVGADAVQAAAGVSCSSDFFAVTCAYGTDDTFRPAAYGGLAALLGAAMLLVAWKRRDSVIFPFVMLFGGLGLGAMSYDLITGAGIVRHGAMINGAMNALSFGLLAGLLLVPLLAVRRGLSLVHLGIAAMITFAGKVAVLALFAVIEPLFRGAIELWLLYFVFLFGAFNLHVGSVSAALAPLPIRARVAANN
jgi:hypothetical protein